MQRRIIRMEELAAIVHQTRHGSNGVICRLATTYEVRGKLASLSSDDKSNIGLENVVNEARFMYDDNSQLTDDYLSHSTGGRVVACPRKRGHGTK